ncbi:hypothetical protein [Enterococcus cecorum]|uniref:hypothetical protein n=1 Tax=Enterococcus cecorum TaxID=44008 RepID=UPI001FAE47B3|nr:hypothetical protein [Enterococcus cecorum]MCJ0567913.1 hypothetical protein [Enterococcus cecorum]
MADEIKLNQEQFNAIIEKLDSIDTTLDIFYKKYVEIETRKQGLEAYKIGYQLNKDFVINDFLKANDPMINGNSPLEFAKMLVEEYPSNNNDTNDNSSINSEKFDELIKEISNSSKDDRNSFNMLVNTLKDTNTKAELKELKSLTISSNELLVKQVNAQNQFNSGFFVFAILVISASVFKFSKNLFSGLF